MSRPNANGPAGGQQSTVVARLREACEPIAQRHGCDLEEVEVKQAGARSKVSIAIDRDGGVDLDTISDISHEISELLDTHQFTSLLKGAYLLDVGSRGTDRPLLEQRHWRRAAGRLVRIELADGGAVAGRLSAIEADGATVTEVADPSRRTSKAPQVHSVAFAEVRRAVVEVDFRALPTETVPDEQEAEDDA